MITSKITFPANMLQTVDLLAAKEPNKEGRTGNYRPSISLLMYLTSVDSIT